MQELIEEYIQKLEGANGAELAGIVEETVAVFAETLPSIKKNLDRYAARAFIVGSPAPVYDYEGDRRKLIGKLRVYLKAQEQAATAVSAAGAQAPNINVTQTANPSISQTQVVTIDACFLEAQKAVSKDEALTKEERGALNQLILEAAEQEESSDDALRKIGREIVSFLFDKATSSIPAVLTYLAQLFAA